MTQWRMSLLALLAHWRRHPLQFFSILVGLWLATALWTGVQALNSQARADYARASTALAGAGHAQLVPRHGERLDQSTYVQLRRAGWPVTPLLEGRVTLAATEPVGVQLLGIEPLSLPEDIAVAGQAGGGFDVTAFMGTPGQAWIAPDTLRRLGLAQGEQARTLDGTALPPLRSQPELAPGVIVLDIGHAQRLLRAPGQLSRLLAEPTFARSSPALPGELTDMLRWQPAEDGGDLQRLTESFHLNLTALGLLAFIVGLFIVHASIGLALEQRRNLLRTLRACGVGLAVLISALALELGLFAIIGGLAGVASGYLVASALLPDVAASLRGLYGAQVAGNLSLSPQWWLAGMGMSLLGALLAGANSLLRAARLPLLALAQPQAWRQAQERWLRYQAAMSAVAIVVAAVCLWFGKGLASAFVLVAAVLLAAALLLPALLDAVLIVLTRFARSPLAQWFVADARQQLPALSLALMALLLALAASVGVGSMTESFRRTFTTWLDHRLSAAVYIAPRDTDQGLAIMTWLDTHPDVDAALPRWHTEIRLGGWLTEAHGTVDHAGYGRQWPLLQQQPQAWEEVAAGRGVMLSEQLSRRLHLGLGDILTVPAPDGNHALDVVALYADYGNPKGHILVGADWLRRHFPDATLPNIGVYVRHDAAPRLQQELAERFGLAGERVVDQATIKRWSTEVFERTFAATGALNSLTLGVAGVALFISLLTLSHARLGQLAPLWALGVARKRLAWLTLGQTLMLSGLTVMLAIPLGLLLAWCLVAVVNVQAFGWRLPMHVFPQQLLQLGLLGVLTSILAAAGPVWQLARRQPADLLRQFSDDR